MKKLMMLFVVLASLVSYTPAAQALFEVRANYGMGFVDPKGFNDEAGVTVPALYQMSGLGLDAILDLPLVPVGFGLRYEMMGSEDSLAGLTRTFKMNRLAVLVNKRLLDFGIFLGVIGSFGLTHDTSYKLAAGGSSATYTADSTFSASVGAEAGMNLLGMLVGAELGYQTIKAKDFKDGTTPITNNPEMDITGIYAKVNVGIGF
jgi:hypothetical protein